MVLCAAFSGGWSNGSEPAEPLSDHDSQPAEEEKEAALAVPPCPSPPTSFESQRVICVSDVHGNAEPLRRLWRQLEANLGARAVAAATVVFLGDLCDRGPRTREVLDFIVDLRKKRGEGRTVCLAGNHDFGFAAFLGCLPADVLPDDLEATRRPDFHSGFWPFPVEGGMHYQGRRWAGSSIYQADETFGSYGVRWAPERRRIRDELLAKVPEEHQELLQGLRWVHEQDVPWPPGRLVCVHAGLVASQPAELQLRALRARDLTDPVVLENGDPGRLAAMSGRRSVRGMHPDLEGRALLVSGHHGEFEVKGDRIVLDLSGGFVGRGRPLQAMVLPERRVVCS